MCIVIIADRKKPTLEDLQAAAWGNQDGAGIAWCEGGRVHWKKGIMGEDPDEVAARVNEIVEAKSLPFLIHFRVATEGGISPGLTHPFPVSVEKPHLGGDMALEGVGDAVLMHNGHWGSWKHEMKECRRFMFTEPKKKGSTAMDQAIPSGPWSDSRAMAWLVSMYGLGYLSIELNHQKVALLDGNGLVWYYATKEWTRDEGGFLRSTSLYKDKSRRVSGAQEPPKPEPEKKSILALPSPTDRFEQGTHSRVGGVKGDVLPFDPTKREMANRVPLADPQHLLEAGEGELAFQQEEVERVTQQLIHAASGIGVKV